jgi:thiol:disulfide interchange protein
VIVDAGVPRKKDVGPIAWIDSEPEARARARRAGRPMLVWVRADWDAATLEMERRVWTDAAVIAKVRPFVALRLDLTEAEGNAELYAKQFDVQGLPTTIVMDQSGKRVASILGYRDAATVLEALQAAEE